MTISDTAVVRTLVVLHFFGALSALVGAVMAVWANGAGVPLEYLENSPFSSFLVPGMILGVIIGGTQLAAAVMLRTKCDRGLLISAVSGFGMQIWIFAELAIMREYSPLQTVYFTLGVVELMLVFVKLGIGRSCRQERDAPSTVTSAHTAQ